MFSKNILIFSFICLMAGNAQSVVYYNKQAIEWQKTNENGSSSALSPQNREPKAQHKQQKNHKKNSPKDKDYAKAARTWRLLFWLLGFLPFMLSVLATIALFMAFFWWGLWIYGAMAMLITLPFFIVSLVLASVYKRKAKAQANNNGNTNPQPIIPQQQDVIYLKNGSIIKGKVLEMNPSGDIKIELLGGSVLVYKMEDVEKIVKE